MVAVDGPGTASAEAGRGSHIEREQAPEDERLLKEEDVRVFIGGSLFRIADGKRSFVKAR